MRAVEMLAQTTGVTTACQVLNVPRSSRYRAAGGTGHPKQERPTLSNQRPQSARALSAEEKDEVRNVLNSQRFQDQSPREVYATLLDEGEYLCHWRTMYRVLDEHKEVRERRNQLRHSVYAKPELLATGPNQLWSWDKAYIRLTTGWLYLVAILDWFSRYVVSWQLDQTLDIDFVLVAVDDALAQAKPLILNSDQGSHFTSPHYTQRLEDADVQISMDGKGRALDNNFTERFWRSLKYEEVYLHDYHSPRQARSRLTDYFDFYNFRRPHQSLGYLTPAQVHFA